MKRFLPFLRSRKHLLQARAILGARNVYSKLKYISSKEKSKVIFENDNYGDRILLLALYEKGELRKDIIRLCREARERGFYVLAVNTLSVEDKDRLSQFIDCYIERHNYGRDFGSYKEGMRHLYARGMDKRLSRLLLMNDSVFYSRKQLPAFLDALAESGHPVLGATENFEVNYHLGSFCISLSGEVVRHERFRDFWRRYRLTDIRPKVIRKGEMALTKTLIGIVGRERVKALYDSVRFEENLKDKDFMDYCLTIRTRDQLLWKKLNPQEILAKFMTDFTVTEYFMEENHVGKTEEMGIPRRSVILGYEDIARYTKKKIGRELTREEEEVLRKCAMEHLLSIFRSGSQIHRNAPVLLKMGCAIVKLDGLYRGAFDDTTVLHILDNMEEDGRELKELLYARPYGGATLTRWKLAAFHRGLM